MTRPSSPRPTSPSHATEGSRLKRKSPTGPPRGDAEREDSGSKRRRKDDSLSPAHDYVPLKRGERSSPPPRPSPLERRKTVTQEEKKRGRRLFGGLLSTLSQKTTNTHQKRREEIERRQAERARQQEAEKEQFRAERAAKVRAIRRAEQVRFDEDMVCSRRHCYVCFVVGETGEEGFRVLTGLGLGNRYARDIGTTWRWRGF